MGNGRREMNRHTQPQLSCIKMKIFHCTSFSAVGCTVLAQSAPKFCILVLFLTLMKEIKLLNFPHTKTKFIFYTQLSVLTLQPHWYPLKSLIVGNSFAQIGFKISDTCTLSQISPIFMASSHSPNHYKSTFMGLYG